MATEKNEETDGNQISSISSIFSEMETMMGDFRERLPDFIEKTITKKPDANPTNIDEVSGSNRINNNRDTDTPSPK